MVVLASLIAEWARSKFSLVLFNVAMAEDASLGRLVRSVRSEV